MPHDFIHWLALIVCIAAAVAIAFGGLALCLGFMAKDCDEICERRLHRSPHLPSAEEEGGAAPLGYETAMFLVPREAERVGETADPTLPVDSLPRDPLRVVNWHPWGTLSGNAKTRAIERRCATRAQRKNARRLASG
jgi:hypothetical protein